MPKSNFIVLLFSLFFVFSCDSNRIYEDYKTVPDSWSKNEVIEFKVNSLDTITPCNLFVNIRNTKTYKYSNLFLIVEMSFPHGKTIKDTLEYRMAAPDGSLLGTGMSSVKENKLWYKENVIFDEIGEYTIKIQHAMRKNGTVKGIARLEGVTDVGFRIEKSLKKIARTHFVGLDKGQVGTIFRLNDKRKTNKSTSRLLKIYKMVLDTIPWWSIFCYFTFFIGIMGCFW